MGKIVGATFVLRKSQLCAHLDSVIDVGLATPRATLAHR